MPFSWVRKAVMTVLHPCLSRLHDSQPLHSCHLPTCLLAQLVSPAPRALPCLPTAVVTSTAWQRLKGVAAREGLVAGAYERRHGPHSRLLQVAKLYLFGASSGEGRGGGHLPGQGAEGGGRGGAQWGLAGAQLRASRLVSPHALHALFCALMWLLPLLLLCHCRAVQLPPRHD